MYSKDLVILGFGISTLLIILGFIALLKQKTYIDSKTQMPTKIKLPFFGEMVTNFPALIFIFCAFIVLYTTIQKSQLRGKTDWTIEGFIANPEDTTIDWRKSELRIKPTSVIADEIDSNGYFFIEVSIDNGKLLEDEIEWIKYSNPYGTMNLYPQKAANGDSVSKLEEKTPTSRKYKITASYYK